MCLKQKSNSVERWQHVDHLRAHFLQLLGANTVVYPALLRRFVYLRARVSYWLVVVLFRLLATFFVFEVSVELPLQLMPGRAVRIIMQIVKPEWPKFLHELYFITHFNKKRVEEVFLE